MTEKVDRTKYPKKMFSAMTKPASEKSITTKAVKKICEVYSDAVKGRTCQLWFKRFKDGDCEISNKPCSGKRPTLNDDLLNETTVSDPRQSTRDSAQKITVSCSTIHEHLKQIGENMQRGNLSSICTYT
ncbi:uncharacterized protein LOC106869745 [Octopus bimaculoides]|uniref:uncharacterized protein LOC106869745 n=1 Tax=Octopus bimaculoides TaxID=37653 RepID=UPI00071E52E7|nr:uncharacterized protein LOC106869745 [Octopus bimaculoides]|eukprot:XP_014771093.1 PREDICTED: uncharacterized protein LOC106869745 [Octopus bimaculoides]